ncbi:MAG: hypothetical protein ACRDRX_22360 [Pseudonocardiaceae bacterium]
MPTQTLQLLPILAHQPRLSRQLLLWRHLRLLVWCLPYPVICKRCGLLRGRPQLLFVKRMVLRHHYLTTSGHIAQHAEER